jgi:uncharacterized protein YggE
MKTARFVALSTLMLTALLGGRAGAADAPAPATLSATGEGSVSRAPDRAVVAFQIQTTDDASARATSANAAIANALTARMVQLGIPSAGVATTSYGLSYVPRPSRPDPAGDQRYGFTVTRTIAVTEDATDRAGAVVDAGVAAGATSVDGVTFTLRDPHGAQRAAQAAAVDDAMAQARGLAAAAGVRLVRIRAIAPGASTPIGRPMPMMRMALGASAAVPTTIDPSNLTVDATVTIEYEIAAARPI